MGAGIPKTIGRYTVERLLGSGAMGFVFLGRDPELDRAVAIKTVRDLGMDEETRTTFLERFRNEARAAARLHHPSIVQVYDVGEDAAAGPYLVFEYVAGSTLKKVLAARGALGPDEVVRLAAQIADALTAAHAHGIIHRDIKPDNLLVTPSGDVKLADFGVARVPNAALTREGQFLGTPCYAAPETLLQGQYGTESDLFSFAAVLYEVVSGVRAFPGKDAVAVAHQVIHDIPRPLREAAPGERIPPAVERLILQGLSKDPSARPKSPHELARALRAAYEAAGAVSPDAATMVARSAAGASSPKPAAPAGRGGSWPYVVVLGAVLVVGIGLVAAYAGPLRHDGPDAGAGTVLVPPRARDAGQALVGRERDAGPMVVIVTTAPDAGAPTPAIDVTGMSRHQREEAAKDAIALARRLLDASDAAGASAKIREALVLDPGNGDAAELARRLGVRP